MHDPRVGRFFATDPLEAKFPHNSPYAFSENRVVDGFEFEGKEVILLFWGIDLKAGSVGHTTIAVANYEMTEEGNYKKNSNGDYIPDGSFTIYNLYPLENVGFANLTETVDGDYTAGFDEYGNGYVKEIDELLYSDPTLRQDRSPDAALLVRTDFHQTQAVREKLEEIKNAKKQYNAIDYNCSDFCVEGINAITKSKIDPEESVKDYDGNTTTITTPLELYNRVKKIKATVSLKKPNQDFYKTLKQAKEERGVTVKDVLKKNNDDD